MELFLALLVLFIAPSAGIYHSSSLLAQDYARMVGSFKIFIYPDMNVSHFDFRRPGSEGTPESLIFQSLAASNLITDDPERADLFLLPVSVAAIEQSRGRNRTSSALKGYIQEIRSRFPFWQRSLGADHVYISCRHFPSDSSRNVLELKKNAIQVACFPLDAGQDFFPHKDVTVPGLGSGPQSHKRRRRNSLVYEPAPGEDTDPEMLGSSSFCVCSRPVIVDAIRHGCIPVIISQGGGLHDLPLQDVIDWRKFALILAAEQREELGQIVAAIEDDEREQMRSGVRLAAAHFERSVPPKPRDAAHMVSYQLWRRRHVTRYTDH